LISGQGKTENVVRQVVVVPFSSDRPPAVASAASAAQAQTQAMASTPEMQEEMRKLIDAARTAVADLQAAAPSVAANAVPGAPSLQPQGYAGVPDVHASQALEAATAMARATTALGQLAAASSGFSGMLPTVRATEGTGPAGASRRIQAVIESLITRRSLNLRLAPAITEAFEGAELKASEYAAETKISKESASRELRAAADTGLLQIVRYPQGEAGFKASQGLLRAVAEGLGQAVNAAIPLTAETIIGSLAVGQTEGTVTIMFTDVEDSTKLLSTRGFTESHDIMKAYETIIDETVADHAGRRIKALGDGFMISFGSARHGVECALAIQEAITEYSKQHPERKIRIRIGLNTGEVVEEAGDIFGAAVNMAARVAGKAKGGQVLVSEIVRQLVGPTSELKFELRGRYTLKGFPDRWRLHQATPGEVKEAPHVMHSAEGFVNREQEHLDIRMVLDRATTGAGGIVFVTGAPGIGASRLASEVAREASAKGWLVFSGRCPEQVGSPYAPFRDVLGAAVAGSTAKVLQEAAGSHGPLIAQLVPSLRTKVRSIPAAGEVHANKVREQLFKSVFDFLTRVQGSKPLLIVLDDLQWADDATVMLLRDMAERVTANRVVIMGTYWDTELDSGRPYATVVSRLLRRRRAQRIALGRLSDHDIERIVTGIAETPLTPVQVIGIQAATEGNPLFAEHSMLYLADQESMLGGAARSQTSFTEEDLELAQSVRGLIGRRLERLSEPAQRMLVAAAVISRDFEVALLEAFGELSGHELREALDEATRGRFLASAGKDRYRFAHDLVRQRVLAPLALPRLQAYHLHVADTLEHVYGKAAPDHAGEIAHHLYQAGTAADPVRTSTFLGQAASNALNIGAFDDVLRLIERALTLLPADKIAERAEALALRGQAFWGLGRIDDAKSAWKGAVQRYEELGDEKAASSLHRRLAHLEAPKDQLEHDGHATEPAPVVPEAEPVA
jgi:class 3 adenylate cyclase/tetratricopeptide (TPR) repeat protein